MDLYLPENYKLRIRSSTWKNTSTMFMVATSYFKGKQQIHGKSRKLDITSNPIMTDYIDLSGQTLESVVVYMEDSTPYNSVVHVSVDIGVLHDGIFEPRIYLGDSFLGGRHSFSFPNNNSNFVHPAQAGLWQYNFGVAYGEPATFTVPAGFRMQLNSINSSWTISAAVGNRYAQILCTGIAPSIIFRGLAPGALAVSSTVELAGFIGDYYYYFGSTITFFGFPEIWVAGGHTFDANPIGVKAGDVCNSGTMTFTVMPWE